VNRGLPVLDQARALDPCRSPQVRRIVGSEDENAIDADCALRSETGCAEFGYFLCYFKIDAPRALIFRPLVKGNKALGTRLVYLPTIVLQPRSQED